MGVGGVRCGTGLLVALGLGASPAAWAGPTWEEITEVWSVEVGPMFAFHGDLSGNVRDIPRAYAEGSVSGDLPLGGGLRFRNVVRVPVKGEVQPALLATLTFSAGGSSGTFEDYGDYQRRASRVDLVTGPGACFEQGACVFAAYTFRQWRTVDDGYPITNVDAVIGDPDDATVDGFVEPYLRDLLGDSLVDVLLSQLDFASQRVTVDIADVTTFQGVSLAAVVGAGERVGLEGSLGYQWVRQAHVMERAEVVVDVDEDDDTPPFDYAYDKSFGAVGLDLALSVGVLPERLPVQTALGVTGSALAFIDLSSDRTVGGYLGGGVMVTTKW